MQMTSYALIMAGGSGERFWPVSRVNRPKQLLRLTDPSETLLEEAVNRISPSISKDHVLIATGLPLVDAIRAEQLIPDENVVAEPSRRNTLGCLCWAAANLMARHPGVEDQIAVAVLTADHKIGEPGRFRRTVQTALDVAIHSGGLVTIGIRPTRSETGYGYVELGEPVSGVSNAYRVASFREKPDLATAEKYVSDGCLWNSGMFFWTLAGFLLELSKANQEAHQVTLDMARQLAAGNQNAAAEEFAKLPNQSIDYALLEKSDNVYTVAADFPWDDVGAWDALERTLPSDDNVTVGKCLLVDCAGTIAYNDNPDMLVSAVGVEDLVIVTTKGAVMVCRKSDAQRVKEILQELPPDSPLR
jgi:mannose-1-phosphate guanylyltransferase